jgi:hypothetical protein
MRRVIAGIALVTLAVAPTSAQRPTSADSLPASPAPHYVPSTKAPEGTEVVAIFISSSWCVANRDSTFKPTVRRMMTRLAEDSRAAGRPLDIIGVSLDWSVADGVRYLQEFGDFDEITVGRNWFNLAAMQYIWRDPDGLPVVPQVVLLERTVGQSADGKRVQVSPDRVLGRYRSVSEIRLVVEQGIPAVPQRDR